MPVSPPGRLRAVPRFALLAAVGLAGWLAAARPATGDQADRSAGVDGLHENTPAVHALVNARVVVSPGSVLAKATVVVRDGVIEAVGADVVPPADARVWDLTGKTIYPGLIDAYTELSDGPVGAGDAKSGGGGGGGGGDELLRPAPPGGAAGGGAPYWNAHVTPQFKAADAYKVDPEANKRLRGQGIVARLVAPAKQIVKGTSAAVSTADGDPARAVLRPVVALHVRLTPASGRGDDRVYPNSPMGAYALVRQAVYDARWYAAARAAWEADRSLPRPEQNDALEALGPAAAGKLPVYVDAPDELYALRADRLGKEFDLPAVVLRGSGQEYRRLSLIAAGKRAVVVPVDFAKPPEVAAPEQAMAVSLDELMDWDLQPENPGRLEKAGVRIALTSHGLKDKAAFLPAVRKAVKRGLPAEAALKALTVTPAELLGLDKTHGTVERGKSASLVVASGDLLADKTQVLETWVDGRRYEVTPTLKPDPRGTWAVTWGEGDAARRAEVKITGTPTKLAGKLALAPRAAAAATRPATGGAPATGPTTAAGSRPATGPATASAATKPAEVELSNLAYLPGHVSFTFRLDRPAAAAGGGAATNTVGAGGGAVPLPAVNQATAAVIDDAWTGWVVLPTGRTVPLRATRSAPATAEDTAPPDDKADAAAAGKSADAKLVDATPADGLAGEGTVAGDRPDGGPATRPAATQAAATQPAATRPAARPPRNDPSTRPASFAVNYPLGAFGRPDLPKQRPAVLFKNATVWTCGPRGKLVGASVLVEAGKIKAVYAAADTPDLPEGTDVVDCAGKHLTPGIIDCHSHTATDGGINESGRAVTCNVRIGDFVDPDDINIYRQMAGGVTTANVLHGSANPIGGQNQVVKYRWGAGPEEMKFAAAPQGVKFALGENVKQSNWGERFTSRYPQTRIGVEQMFRDRFAAALEYRAAHDRFKAAGGKGMPPRFDLELEALSEIVAGTRLIHCHSYRQDEILALLRACEAFGVKVATLQHILEGYKVADAIAKHGAGASTFSDWWAYKFEVYDAIPYNGAVLRDAGVTVSFNSDDNELARRLNLEAAKAVKYGNVPEAEALKFVTLNPAKQLRIDKWVGSIEPGKDADLVVWSGPPLSNMTRCEQTWVDGRRFFDRAEDQQMRQRDADRRAKLVQKALAAGAASGGADAATAVRPPRERDKWAREDLYCGCRAEGGK
jgi:imidazolonepropionase-like amidohydrolase